MIPAGLGPAHVAKDCPICKAYWRRHAALGMAEAFAWARGARAQVAAS